MSKERASRLVAPPAKQRQQRYSHIQPFAVIPAFSTPCRRRYSFSLHHCVERLKESTCPCLWRRFRDHQSLLFTCVPNVRTRLFSRPMHTALMRRQPQKHDHECIRAERPRSRRCRDRVPHTVPHSPRIVHATILCPFPLWYGVCFRHGTGMLDLDAHWVVARIFISFLRLPLLRDPHCLYFATAGLLPYLPSALHDRQGGRWVRANDVVTPSSLQILFLIPSPIVIL